jgi:hypothetical protein
MANVPKKKHLRDLIPPAQTGSASEIRRAMLETSRAKPIVVRDVEEKQIADFSDPQVASHCAAVLTKHLMDAAKAARELRPDLSPGDSAILAHQIRNAPEVRAQVQHQLEAFGLSEKAKKVFFQTVWRHALDDSPQNERKQIAALRLLARGFGLGEQSVRDEKPATLRIVELESGLERMGLGAAVLASVPAAEFSPADAQREAEEDQLEEEN